MEGAAILSNLIMLILITGPRNCGKTACAGMVARRMSEAGGKPGGVITRAEYHEGKKKFYFVQSVKTGQEKYLLELTPDGPQQDNKGFVFARRALLSSGDCDIIFVDEFGPIEMLGDGFLPAIGRLRVCYDGVFVVTVRPALAAAAKKAFGRRTVKVVDLQKSQPGKASDKIVKWLSK